MKLTELLEDKQSFGVVSAYQPPKINGEFSDLDNKQKYMSFLKGEYAVSLQELFKFLEAWVILAKEHNYNYKNASLAMMKTKNMLNKLGKAPVQSEELHQKNLTFISSQIKKTLDPFIKVAARTANKLGLAKTAEWQTELAMLLQKVAAEIDANRENSETTARKLGLNKSRHASK